MKRFVLSLFTLILYFAVNLEAKPIDIDIGASSVINCFDDVYLNSNNSAAQAASDFNSCKGHESKVIFYDLYSLNGIQVVELLWPFDASLVKIYFEPYNYVIDDIPAAPDIGSVIHTESF